MGDRASKMDAHARLESDDGVRAAWEAWSAGDVVPCESDGAPIALNVDATVATYRFVCTHCGMSSPWFEVSNGAIHVRPSIHSMSTRPSMPDV